MNPIPTQSTIATHSPIGIPNPSTTDRGGLDSTAGSSRSLVPVLHIVNGEHYSGAERVQDLLGNRLTEFGYEVSFACLKPGLFPEKRKFDSVKLYRTPMRGRFDFQIGKRISNLVREQQFQIIHAHTPRSALVAASVARRTGLPFVYHVHSPTSRDSTRWLINRLNQFIEKRAIRRAAHLVTVSDSLKQHMIQLGVAESKITAIPNGVPTVDHPTPHSNESFTIGTFALFRPRKGTEKLLEAFAKIYHQNPQLKLLAVGPFETKEYESSLRQLARDLDIEKGIKWTGFVSDVNQYYSKIDLFVLPSLFGEGLPMVVLEAMSNRRPVIASDVEGIPQAIRNGIDGLICKAGDSEDLARQIQQLVDDPSLAAALASNGYERQRECFSDTSMSRRLAEVYGKLLT